VNDGSYNDSYSVTSVSVWDLGKFKCLMFVAKCTAVCGHFARQRVSLEGCCNDRVNRNVVNKET